MRIGLDRQTSLVLHQGAPAPARGCEALIAAIERLPGTHLVFLGDPEPGYETVLRDLARRHDVQDRVTLLPSVPLSELLAHTAEADVGVTLLQDTCENHRLALPNKLFEYIAAGVPVVASALPEIRRLIESYEVGWCVPPDDSAALAQALRMALQHRGDSGLAGRLQTAGRELCWSREQARLLVLYDQLAGGSGTRDHKPVRTQRRDPDESLVHLVPDAAGDWRGERNRANRELSAQRSAQLGDANQPRMSVDGGYTRLPDSDHAAGDQHATRLAKGSYDVVAGPHGG
jgi:hypothetical protein